MSDYNRDGWPDLYVVNDFGWKNLWSRNHGDGNVYRRRTAVGMEDVGAGMGVCWLDYDNDGAGRPLRRRYVDCRWDAHLCSRTSF